MSEEKTVKAAIYRALRAKHTTLENAHVELQAMNAELRAQLEALTKAKDSIASTNSHMHTQLSEKNLEIEELQTFCDMLPDAAPRRQPDTYRDTRVGMRLLAYFAAKANKS